LPTKENAMQARSPGRVDRRLAAILAADVVGYSRLVGLDEEGALNRLKALRADLIDPNIAEHHGRIVKTTGDGILTEFASVVDAVRCAIAVQRGTALCESEVPEERRITFRVGVNLGDVVVDGDDILGDGVNIAVRLEGIAEPGTICLSGSAYDQVRDKLDCGFDDMGERQVKNIARPVRVYRIRLSEASTATAPAPALPLPEKPSIAVLPFANMSGDPEQDYFADGMVEEIITALSRIRWLFVIARNSSFTYKGQSVDVKRVGRELGVRYVLEGSVRKGGNRVRITAQLIEAETGAHLWADRFDGSLEDVFDLQDKVAVSVAGVIEPTLRAAETRRSWHRPPADLTAYDLYLRARQEWLSRERSRVMMRALSLLDQAFARDPGYAPALALAAHCHHLIDLHNWADDLAANRREGVRLARKALQSGADDPVVLANAGLVLGWFGEDIDTSLRLVGRALALNPSYAEGWHLSGFLHVYAGHTDIAIERLETSSRLDPRANRGYRLAYIGVAHFFNKRFDEALKNLLLSLEEKSSFITAHRFLAACYAHMGQLQQAQETVERLRNVNPAVWPNTVPYRNPEHRELFLSGLRLAIGDEAP
jgi:adenylate cyclase